MVLGLVVVPFEIGDYADGAEAALAVPRLPAVCLVEAIQIFALAVDRVNPLDLPVEDLGVTVMAHDLSPGSCSEVVEWAESVE